MQMTLPGRGTGDASFTSLSDTVGNSPEAIAAAAMSVKFVLRS